MIARSFLTLPLLLLSALVGCGNPSIDDKIATLPNDGLTPSDAHRAGQPCVLCHGPYKGASPEMIIAGTIFAKDAAGKLIPAKGAEVNITTSLDKVNGATPPLKTNCAGNFYLTHDQVFTQFALDTIAFPLNVEIKCPNGSTQTMQGRISRDGSCGGCHTSKQDQDSPGLIICDSVSELPNKQTCPGLFQ